MVRSIAARLMALDLGVRREWSRRSRLANRSNRQHGRRSRRSAVRDDPWFAGDDREAGRHHVINLFDPEMALQHVLPVALL